jgi:pimeloyl-ACP methyl ester carboxylesterase
MSTYTPTTVSTQLVEANRIRFAYRRWGKHSGLPLVFNQHFTGNLDSLDPAVLDGLAKEREVSVFNIAGVASSTGVVPTTFAGVAKSAEAFIDGLGLTNVDLLGFSSGGMIAQQITLDRPGLIRKLILVGTAPRNLDAGDGRGRITPETAAGFGATQNPPENLGLKVFFTDSDESQAAGRAFLKRHLSRAKNRDTPISAQGRASTDCRRRRVGISTGRTLRVSEGHQAADFVVSGNHGVIVYTMDSLYLLQNMPNAKLILYADANHGSWYENQEDFVFEAGRFLDASDGITSIVTSVAAD